MDLDWVQWPAMLVTLAAAWWVASKRDSRRRLGFWAFILSNVLWILWALPAHAYALIGLQIGLAALNIRGVFKTEPAA